MKNYFYCFSFSRIALLGFTSCSKNVHVQLILMEKKLVSNFEKKKAQNVQWKPKFKY